MDKNINLIVDTGNTFHKIAVMSTDNILLEERVVAELTEDIVDELFDRFAPSKAIISSTRGDAARSRELIAERGCSMFFVWTIVRHCL